MPPDHPQLWILALQSNGPAHMGISTALDGQEALSTTMCPINTFLHLGCHALLLMVSEVLWIQTMALLTLQDQGSLQEVSLHAHLYFPPCVGCNGCACSCPGDLWSPEVSVPAWGWSFLAQSMDGMETEKVGLGLSFSPPTHRNSWWFYTSLGNVAASMCFHLNSYSGKNSFNTQLSWFFFFFFLFSSVFH